MNIIKLRVKTRRKKWHNSQTLVVTATIVMSTVDKTRQVKYTAVQGSTVRISVIRNMIPSSRLD